MEAGARPRVAAIIVHYGDPAPTRRCLDSLGRIDEVVLVDQPPQIFGEHPRVTKRIAPGANIGFAAACNRGVAATDAPFVLLLNNDAVLEPGAADELHAALPALAPDIAGACLKLLFLDGATLQSAGGLWFTRDGIGFPHGFGDRDAGQYDALPAGDIGVPSGAAGLYRRSAWDEAGGMSEAFFCYCEDGDLGLRMVAAGHRFAWLPAARVRHELSSASGPHSLLKTYHVERNHFATMIHAAPFAALALLPLITIARLALAAREARAGRGAAREVASTAGLTAIARTLLTAWCDAIRMLPSALRERRSLRARHPLGRRRVAAFLATHHVTLSDFLLNRSLE